MLRSAGDGKAQRARGRTDAPTADVGADRRSEEATGIPVDLKLEGAEDAAAADVDTTSPSQTNPSGKCYRGLVRAAEEVFAAAAKGRAPESGKIIAAVRRAYKQLEKDDELLSETVRQRRDFRSWPQRAANVAILAMRMGKELEADERRILALGLCGLMHDVGMLSVPDEVLDSPKLSDSQFKLLQQHPLKSKRMILRFGKFFSWIGKIVAQTHERRDGRGYPQGLKGEEIHEIAQVLGLADSYEAMAHPRPDRKAKAMYHTVKEIIDQRNSQFDRLTIRALIHIVSIFPLGSLVKLNNGEIGRVLGISPPHPTRPRVEVLVDSKGRRQLPGRIIDLGTEPLIYIVDPAIEEEAVERAKSR